MDFDYELAISALEDRPRKNVLDTDLVAVVDRQPAFALLMEELQYARSNSDEADALQTERDSLLEEVDDLKYDLRELERQLTERGM